MTPTIRSQQLVLTAVFAIVAAIALSGVALAFSAEKDLTSQQTYDLQQQKKLVLVDVRTEPEWRQTGLAKGAVPISMQDPKFFDKFRKVLSDNPGKTVAFICASGVRSSIVQSTLTKNGFENTYSVFGGTTGSSDAPGWIADGLPVEPWAGK